MTLRTETKASKIQDGEDVDVLMSPDQDNKFSRLKYVIFRSSMDIKYANTVLHTNEDYPAIILTKAESILTINLL